MYNYKEIESSYKTLQNITQDTPNYDRGGSTIYHFPNKTSTSRKQLTRKQLTRTTIKRAFKATPNSLLELSDTLKEMKILIFIAVVIITTPYCSAVAIDDTTTTGII